MTKKAEKKAKDEQKEKNQQRLTEFFNSKWCKYNSQRRWLLVYAHLIYFVSKSM